MNGDYEVQQGECISSIAFEHEFFWETLWNHARNVALKQPRRVPSILVAGHVVRIPDLIPGQESCEVEEVKARQRQTQTGKYGSMQSKPHQPARKRKGRIEIEMVDEEDQPVPGDGFRITLSDGAVAEGMLDDKGFTRVDGVKPGNCQSTFPDFDQDAWRPL